MHSDILFLSDLHLSLEKPILTDRFLDFLANRATQAQAVYILGDLFDVWVGDDDSTPPNPVIRKQLKQLVDSGVSVYFQPGNRDFLLGKQFCEATGVILLEDYTVINLFGTPTLLMHGDLLCTDDVAYQEFRKKSHTEQWRNSVLSKPLFLRLLVARWYRFRSFFHKRKKSPTIMDVNQQTVLSSLSAWQCLRLIHGHTHRPGIHEFDLNGQRAQRFVLSAWSRQSAAFLCWNASGYQIEFV